MVSTQQQATGKKLGSFELLREVCASSVGATFIARPAADASSPQVVLTKVHRHVAKSPQLCEAFLQAAKKAAELSSPAIARVLDSGTADGEIFVAHEHHDGDTLATLLRRAGPDGLPLPVAMRIVLDVLDAIRAAHAAGADFGHGELGPWCVHLGADGRSRVSGFAVDRALTRFGLHFAKNLERLPFAAPERVKAMSLTLGPPPPAPDLRADAFSAAVLAWELFTRQRLFASRMEAAVIQKVLASAIPDPKSQRADIGELISRALVSQLARDPAERTHPDELARAIETSEVASYEAVAEFAASQVDKSQTRAVGTPSAFASVRPPPAAAGGPISVGRPKPVNGGQPSATKPEAASPAAPLVTGQNGAAAKSPEPPRVAPTAAVRTRAKTLMGFAAAAPTQLPAEKAAPSSQIEDEATQVTSPKPEASAAAGAAGPTELEDESTSVDSDLLVEAEETPQPANVKMPTRPPPMRRPPPKPRQQTLLGVDGDQPPLEPEAKATDASATEAKPLEPSPASSPVAEAPPAAKPAAPEPRRQRNIGLGNSLDRLAPGRVLGTEPNAYELLGAIARGGMATLWAARRVGQTGIDDLVAVKTLLPELSDDADFETMFVDEMRVAAKIRHPNVAEILAVGDDDGVMYIAMEWVDGETFGAVQEASRTSGGVPLPILLRMASDVCAGLHAAHELRDEAGHLLDLVHRDINPSNVLVGTDGVSKVVDFGIAKSKGRVHVTRAGSTVKGKTPYLSPEQLGGLQIDRRADLFSLGALLYLMATGVHPFRGESELKTIENIVIKSPASLRTIVTDIHPEFDALVLRLLEKDPKKRPASAEDVRGELERIARLLDKPASGRDVGNFVQNVLADVLRKRKDDLLAACRELGEVPAATGLAVDALPTADAPAIEPAAPISEAQPLASDAVGGVPVFDLSAAPRLDPAAADEDVDVAPEPRRSPWLRLVVLIVIGVVVGVGVIALIEATRGPDPAPSSKPSATARSTTTATAAATTPKVTAEPTATAPALTVEPTATAATTAEPSATVEPSATAEPTATATMTAPPPATAKPVGPGPGPGPKPKPTGSAKKPPPKYNPSGI